MNQISILWKKFRNGIMQMLSANVINKVVGMLSNMVITRILTVNAFGEWSYILNIYSYFSLLSGFGLLNGAFQFGAENRGDEKEFSYYKYCLDKGLLCNTLVVVAGIIYFSLTTSSFPQVNMYLILYLPYLIFEYVLNLLLTVLRCENRIKEYASILNMNTVLLSLGTCIGAIFSIEGIIFGKYISCILSLIVIFSKIRSETQRLRGGSYLDKIEIQKLWHFSVMACISSAMNSLLYLFDVTMITSLIGDVAQTAIYKVATMIPNAIGFIPASVIFCILPNIINNNNNQSWLRNTIKRYYFFFFFVNSIMSIVLIIFAPLVIIVLSGRQYLAAVPAYRVLMCGYCISSTFRGLSTNILFGLKKVNVNMITNIVSGTADIILNFLLIGEYGMIGAAYATVISETIASIISFAYTIYIIYFSNKLFEKQLGL